MATIEESGNYYPLALSAAAAGNLSGAARLSLCALSLGEDEDKSRRLLGICLLELGQAEQAAAFLSQCPDLASQAQEEHRQLDDALASVRKLREGGRWRDALKAARGAGRDSVRMLLVEGCLLAEAGRYAEAGRVFALAQEKDTGSADAAALLRESANRVKPHWWSR